MKLRFSLFTKPLVLTTAILFSVSGALNAQQDKPAVKDKAAKKLITFADLEKKLHFDNAPIAAQKGVVLSYAPALSKAMPAVVTVTSWKAAQKAPERNAEQEELFRKMFPDVPEDFFEKHGGGKGGKGDNGGGRGRERGLGSGVIIHDTGYIITNNHVVRDADEIVVSLSGDSKEYPATVIGTDPQTDVALIKIKASGLKAITIADSAKLRIGDVAFAIGNPLGLEQTATQGIVSALGRSDLNIIGNGYENFIQTDASINKGNSGGALVDAGGRLIGINTAIQSPFGGNIGIGFAIPSNMAVKTIKRLLNGGGTVHRGFLGVFLKEADPEFARALGRKDQSGVVVVEVGEGTPAEQYGIKAGDLIVGFNGQKTKSMPKLRLDISNSDPGAKVRFEVLRSGKVQNVEVVLGDLENRGNALAASVGGTEKPKPPKAKELMVGVQISNIDDKLREAMKLADDFKGVLVKSVNDSAPAAEAGLRSGLIITQIDQRDVSSVKEAYELVGKISGDVALLQVYANGRRDILAVELKK